MDSTSHAFSFPYGGTMLTEKTWGSLWTWIQILTRTLPRSVTLVRTLFYWDYFLNRGNITSHKSFHGKIQWDVVYRAPGSQSNTERVLEWMEDIVKWRGGAELKLNVKLHWNASRVWHQVNMVIVISRNRNT